MQFIKKAAGVMSFGAWGVYRYSIASARTAKIVVVGKPNQAGDEAFEKLPSSANIVQYVTSMEEVDGIDTSANVLFVSEICTPNMMTKILQRMPQIDWIHSRWAGINHMLCPELIENEIPVTNAKGAYSYSLGEFCLFGCLYFEKLAPRMLQQKKDHHWEKFMVGELKGKTLGIIGYGDIGRHCAIQCKKNGMKIASLRRRAGLETDDIIDIAFDASEINKLMSVCDYVCVALPLTPQTHHLVNKEVLSHAKPGCVILNVGRGPCIKEDDLVEALQDGTIRGACLDVFEVEPLPKESPLWDMDNVFISPHTADVTDYYHRAGVEVFLDKLDYFLDEKPFDAICDKRAGY